MLEGGLRLCREVKEDMASAKERTAENHRPHKVQEPGECK